MQQPGFFWHVYPDTLLGRCHGYDERAEDIRTHKPSHEQELHLRLFQPVKGELPQEVVEAWKTFNEAWEASEEAWNTYDEAWEAGKAEKAYDEAGEACYEAGKAFGRAVEVFVEALKAYEEAFFNHKDEIEALHADECPDCPWDGETIFSAA